MAKYIWPILRSAPAISVSWGSENRRGDMEGLWFHVNGLKHKEWVAVLYNEGQDLFEVRLLDNSGTEKNHITEVYLDCLADIIDGLRLTTLPSTPNSIRRSPIRRSRGGASSKSPETRDARGDTHSRITEGEGTTHSWSEAPPVEKM